MTTTKTYDSLDRLSSISSAPAAGDPVSYAYQYNAAGQREQMTLANGTYWTFGYNDRGEVTSGGKKLSGGTNLNGYQFGYSFDAIGNRVGTVTNGRSAGYTANNLNQYVSRTVPGYVNVVGEAKTDTAVTVNGQATARQGTFYHRELTVDNSISPVFLTTEVTGTRGSDVAVRQGKVFVPKTPESFSHDADGNLLSDGRWNYTWDGENRLIVQETTTAAAAAGTPRVRLSFTYDYMGRRTSKKLERNWNGTSYQDSYTLLFVWDGWNMVAEVLQGGPRVRTYAWGLDLSGSPQGAGGVGGLLFINQYPENKSYAVGYDGNGNVTALFDMAEQGALAAHYEYGPFGEPLVVTGPYAEVNPIRWSTKYQDRESGFAYYGFRYYNPELGRWPNRDPIGERGFQVISYSEGANINEENNLYAMVSNDPLNKYDFLGLEEKASYCCGPDVTKVLKRTLAEVERIFNASTKEAQERYCSKLVSTGGWDIIGLKANQYTKKCNEKGKCEETVWVDGGCHYVGSVNYVLYGKAFSLCDKSGVLRKTTIFGYKGVPFINRSQNHGPSQEWAAAGQAGWPNANTPSPDREECKKCPHESSLSTFRGHFGGMMFGNTKAEWP